MLSSVLPEWFFENPGMEKAVLGVLLKFDLLLKTFDGFLESVHMKILLK